MIERFLTWLGETPWSVALLESLYMWAFVESAHVLALGLFIIMTVTGLLLFYSQPVRYYYNLFFRIKVLVMLLAGANIAIFHNGVHRHAAEWDDDASPPRAARIAGAVSLAVWTVVVVTGRLIAYNWFDCDIQPQPAWVNWAAGCPVGTE